MCMVDDADGWVELDSGLRTARKEHRCGECDRVIAKGERYYSCSGVTDVGIITSKLCEHCHAAAEWLIVACSGYPFGGVLEDLREHAEHPELTSETLRGLIAGIEAKWRWAGASSTGALMPIPDRARVAESVPAQARARAFA